MNGQLYGDRRPDRRATRSYCLVGMILSAAALLVSIATAVLTLTLLAGS